LESLLCTAQEQADLERLGPAAKGAAAKLVFCAKEAFYKCQHPQTALELDFTDIAVTLDPATQRFAVDSSRKDVRRRLRNGRLEGHFRTSGGYAFAGATLYSRVPGLD
jgi:4'-phosphopantetheinyl transferase EntD